MPFQSKVQYVEELEYEGDMRAAKIAQFLLDRGAKLKDVRDQIERYLELETYEEEKIFRYLLIDGAVNDFDTAMQQTKRIQRIVDPQAFLIEIYSLPDDMLPHVNFEDMWQKFQMSNSVFYIENFGYCLQEA